MLNEMLLGNFTITDEKGNVRKETKKETAIRLAKVAAITWAINKITSDKTKEYLYDTTVTKIGENIHVTDEKNDVYSALCKFIYDKVNNKLINLHINSHKSSSRNVNGRLYSLEDGLFFANYKDCLLIIKKANYAKTKNSSYNKIHINIIGTRDIEVKHDIVDFINNDLSEIKMKHVSSSSNDNRYINFTRYSGKDHAEKMIPYRSIDTIYSDQLDQVIEILNKWFAQKDIFKEHDLPYKIGILLYGEPGTGKTSIIRAIASHFGYDIMSINLATTSAEQIEKIFDNSIREKTIVMLEEIDMTRTEDIRPIKSSPKPKRAPYLASQQMTMNDESDNSLEVRYQSSSADFEQERSKKIKALQQVLDGIESSDNIIFIATTNFLDKVEPALIRDGRFDHHVNVTNISESRAIEMCKAFDLEDEAILPFLHSYEVQHPKDASGNDVDLGYVLKEGFYNPALLQKFLLNYRANQIVKEIEQMKLEGKWVDEVEEVDPIAKAKEEVKEESKYVFRITDEPDKKVKVFSRAVSTLMRAIRK